MSAMAGQSFLSAYSASKVEFDQSVWGGYDGAPHPEAPL